MVCLYTHSRAGKNTKTRSYVSFCCVESKDLGAIFTDFKAWPQSLYSLAMLRHIHNLSWAYETECKNRNKNYSQNSYLNAVYIRWNHILLWSMRSTFLFLLKKKLGTMGPVLSFLISLLLCCIFPPRETLLEQRK